MLVGWSKRMAGAALALGLLTPGAAAASPFTLSQHGQRPDVAVDAHGDGHFVWTQPASDLSGNDVTEYCRVPRGGSACEVLTELPVAAISYNYEHAAPRVLVSGDSVTVLTTRGGNDTVYRFTSADRGLTFGAPADLGDDGYAPLSDALLGPGATLTRIGSGGEVKNTASGGATVLDLFGDGSHAVLGLDGGAPVAAVQSDATHILFRKHNGAGAVTSAAAWGPVTDAGPGSGPRLVSGGGGVYLFSRDGTTPYTVRHLDGAAFGSASNVTAPSQALGSEQGFAEDAAGGLHAVYRDIGEGGLQGGALYTSSVDGGRTWAPLLALADRSVGNVFNLRVAAAGVKDGFAVWDSNSTGQVQAAALGSATPVVAPPPGGGPAPPGVTCPTVRFRPVDAQSLDGCWVPEPGGAYVAPGRARVNGLDLDPKAGAQVVVDPVRRTVATRGGAGAYVHAGALPVAAGPVSWKIPDASGVHVADADTGALGADLFGLKVKGTASVDLGVDESSIGLHVALPAVFGGVTGDVRVKADNASGLRVDGVDVEVQNALLGPLQVEDLALHYLAAGSVWQGKADLVLPPRPPGAKLSAAMGFKGGAFDYANGSFTFPSPGLAIAPSVFLNEIHFALSTHPTKLAGGVKVTGGPQVLGQGAVEIDGDLSYTFADPPAPAILAAQGTGKVVGIPIADVALEYRSSGLFTFGAHLNYDFAGFLHVGAGIDGFVDTRAGTFMVDGKGELTCAIPLLCPLKVEALLSSKGVGVCGSETLLGIPVELGFAYAWSGKVELFLLTGCDLGDYRVSASGAGARAAQTGGARAVTLRAGRFAMVGVAGAAGAPPRVTLRRGGATVATKAIVDAEHGVTYLFVPRPKGGAYRVVPAAGSPAITKVAAAAGLPKASVHARVGGKAYKRTLSYRLTPIRGQKVTFTEESGSVARRLGVARGARGTLRFTPGNGRAGRRTIWALVEQGGRPRAKLKVATYRAPAPRRPGTPRAVKAARAARTVTVTWRRVAGVKLYRVEATLTDGRHAIELVRATRLVLTDVAPAATGTVKVAAATPDLRTGRAATAKVAKLGAKRATPKRKQKRPR